jgi:trehalose 6-phosphate phosphatase
MSLEPARSRELPEPTTAAGREGLAAFLAEPQRSLAALDYDGTLSTIALRPEDATPAPGALEAVGLLAERVGSVVLISGRPAGQLLELTGLRRHPARHLLTVLAQYGLERWDGSTDQLTSPAPLPGVEGARRALADLLANPHTPQGVSVEDKGQALVVHTRLTSDPDGALGSLRPRLDAIAAQAGLEPHPARNALELRPPGYEKGGALLSFASERGSKAVLFIGDDLGDIPAFDALGRLRGEGIPGLGVVSDSAEVTGLRERADLLLDGPPAVVSFLRDLAEQLS